MRCSFKWNVIFPKTRCACWPSLFQYLQHFFALLLIFKRGYAWNLGFSLSRPPTVQCFEMVKYTLNIDLSVGEVATWCETGKRWDIWWVTSGVIPLVRPQRCTTNKVASHKRISIHLSKYMFLYRHLSFLSLPRSIHTSKGFDAKENGALKLLPIHGGMHPVGCRRQRWWVTGTNGKATWGSAGNFLKVWKPALKYGPTSDNYADP
jgi:hypothetical protein